MNITDILLSILLGALYFAFVYRFLDHCGLIKRAFRVLVTVRYMNEELRKDMITTYYEEFAGLSRFESEDMVNYVTKWLDNKPEIPAQKYSILFIKILRR